uniref:Putative ovule protein n=1 Tax=Solanum chacoense TaxID=4108 RepID=A0A0V0HPB1_SOLCH
MGCLMIGTGLLQMRLAAGTGLSVIGKPVRLCPLILQVLESLVVFLLISAGFRLCRNSTWVITVLVSPFPLTHGHSVRIYTF